MSKAKNKAKKVAKAATAKAKNIAKKASDNPIQTAKIVGGVALLVVGFVVVRGLAKRTSDLLDGGLLEGDPDIVDQIEIEVQTPGITATITPAQATNFAAQLLDAFNAKEPFWGTDEEVVEAVFDKLQNAADFALVSDAFGTKDYNGYNSPPLGIWSHLDSYEERNLVYWLREEIKPDDGNVYTKVKSRVESAGLVF